MKLHEFAPRETSTQSSFADTFRRSYKLVAAVLIVGFVLAAVAAFKVHTKYSATASLLKIDSSPSSNSGGDAANGAQTPIGLSDLPLLASSTKVLSKVSDDLHSALSVDALRGGVRASIGGGSSVMHVQFTSKNPALAIDATNALAHEVAVYYRSLSTARFDSLISDLKGQVAALSSHLETLDTELGTQAKSYPFVDVGSPAGGGTGGISVFDRLTQLRTQHDDAVAAVAADQSNLTASRKLIDNSKPVAQRDLVDSDPVYKNLADQYAKDNQELQHIQSFGNLSYPGRQDLETTVANEAQAVAAARAKIMTRSLAGNAAYAGATDAITRNNAQLMADTARLESINSDRTRLESEIGSGSIASTVARLRRDRDDTDAAYRAMSNKLSDAEAQRAQASAIGSLMVLEHATFASAQPLTSGRYMAFGIIFLTLWIAVSIVMFMNRPKTTRTTESMYNFDGHVSNLTHEDIAAATASAGLIER